MSATTLPSAWVQGHEREVRTRRATYRKMEGGCAQVIIRLHRLTAIFVQC